MMTPENNHHFDFQYKTENIHIVAENMGKALEGFAHFVGKTYEELRESRDAKLLKVDGKPV